MELNERKMKILQAIISSYIDTAEPVGSRTISKNYDLGISPATIRNEMSDLEELGFIEQPHTSAGRIPSDKGYRLYVDMLLENQKAQMQRVALMEDLVKRTDRIETLLQNIVTMLAQETNYATIISTPQYSKSKVKSIQLVGIDEAKVLAVVVTDSNMIKNFVIDLKETIEQNVLNRLTYIMNEHLYNLTLEQINLPLIQSIKSYAMENEEVVSKVLDVIYQTIQLSEEMDVYTSGATNILRLPEFNDVNKAMELIQTLEEKQSLKNILTTSMNDQKDGDVQIHIGEEIPLENMKDCSIITANYNIGNGVVGSIGIIGPKRMDYEHTISCLKQLIKNLEDKLAEPEKGS